jgi:adenylate kinase
MQRLAGRRICPKCGSVYNVHSLPEGTTTCTNDGTELYQRPDDTEEVIGKRLEVYERQTRPLVEHYSKLGLLRAIAGEGELDDVFERMEAAALAKPVPAAKVKVQRARAAAKPNVAHKAETPRKAAVVKPAGKKTQTASVKKAAKTAKPGSKAKLAAKSKARARKRAPRSKVSSKPSSRVKAKVKAKTRTAKPGASRKK